MEKGQILDFGELLDTDSELMLICGNDATEFHQSKELSWTNNKWGVVQIPEWVQLAHEPTLLLFFQCLTAVIGIQAETLGTLGLSCLESRKQQVKVP